MEENPNPDEGNHTVGGSGAGGGSTDDEDCPEDGTGENNPPIIPDDPIFPANPAKPIKDGNCTCIIGTSDGRPEQGLFNAKRIRPDNTTYYHEGLDVFMEIGDPVYAIYDGVVKRCIFDHPDVGMNTGAGDTNSGGNRVRIFTAGGQGVSISYMHLMKNNIANLGKYSKVVKGQLIGYSGASGNASEDRPHLHIQANWGEDLEKLFDPMLLLPDYFKVVQEGCSSPNCYYKK